MAKAPLRPEAAQLLRLQGIVCWGMVLIRSLGVTARVIFEEWAPVIAVRPASSEIA